MYLISKFCEGFSRLPRTLLRPVVPQLRFASNHWGLFVCKHLIAFPYSEHEHSKRRNAQDDRIQANVAVSSCRNSSNSSIECAFSDASVNVIKIFLKPQPMMDENVI